MTRSEIMRRVRRKDTTQELIVRSILYDLGFRYRVNVRGLPGSPDIANNSKHRAIFVHGCFWHRHNCPLATIPKSNRQFWLKKFEQNAQRDLRQFKALRELGFKVLVVWQCELNDIPRLRSRLKRFIS
ncbi:MAG: DNA mismatch endonuclease Vsr [Bacteroidetes bacterium]|nr:DNA mismatch endonuclease Vsr [Bacteroidota bacterium]